MPQRGAGPLRAAAEGILSERQFHPSPGLLQRLINAVITWLDHVFGSHVAVGSVGVSDLRYAVLVVILLGLAIATGLALKGGALGRLRHPKRRGVVVATEGDKAMGPEAWRREADLLAAAGEYREALRCRYRALVAELAVQGLVEEVPGRTSGDYERLVSALLPEVADQFSALSRMFERCWYGHEPVDAQAQNVFGQRAASIVAGASRRRARSPDLVGAP